MEGHAGKLCSRYIYRLLDPSLGPFSASVLPVDLASLLLIQYLPEGKSLSLKFLEGSTLGVSLLIESFELCFLQGEKHANSFWCVMYEWV